MMLGALVTWVMGAKSVTESYGSFLYNAALTKCVLLIVNNEYPSGGALATLSAPIVEPAPGRLSTTTCCPSASVNFWVRIRPGTSAAPPAENGTTSLTGWVG